MLIYAAVEYKRRRTTFSNRVHYRELEHTLEGKKPVNHIVNEMATICITGATDGIGKELGKQYLEHGYRGRSARLILIGRRAISELDPVYFNEENYCHADLSESSASQVISSWLDDRGISRIDLLIHNAGAGYVGRLEEQSDGSIQSLLRVNLETPIALTHELIKWLDGGKVAFVSSVASALPTPEYAVYSATKAALDGFARNIRTELGATQSRYKVDVQLILPGATKTRMHEKSGADLDSLNWEKFPPVELVAARIHGAIEGRRFTSPIGLNNGLFRILGRHLAPMVDSVVARQFHLKYPRRDDVTTSARIGTRQMGFQGGHPTAEQVMHEPVQCGKGHAVITGAADGIGRALTEKLLGNGYSVMGIDVDSGKAKETQAELDSSNEKLEFMIADLSRYDDLKQIEEKLVAGPSINLLIHNAGISAVGHFPELEIERQRRVLDVNLRAPMLLTANILRNDLMAPHGTLVFVSSLSYYAGYPGGAVYGASKDGLASFARSVGVGLRRDGINVLTVFPGPTRTAHARRYSPDNSREEKRMTPADLADQIVAAVEKRAKRLVPGLGNKVAATTGKYFPRLMDHVMRKVIWDKLRVPTK